MRFINAVICTIGVFVFLFGLAGLILSNLLSPVINVTGTWSTWLFMAGGIALFWWGNHRDEVWSRRKDIYIHHPRNYGRHRRRHGRRHYRHH